MDADVERALRGLAPSGPWRHDVATARAAFRLLVPAARRDASVRVTARTAAGGDGQPLPLRVYVPADRREPAPGAVWFHGGAFVFGDLDAEDLSCRRVCARLGAVVVSVDYRLAPEHPFPAGVEDCYSALVHTAAAADELGIDPGRLLVGGHSAGGGLAAAVALMARDRGGPPLAFQYLGYPALDDRLDTPSARAAHDPRTWDRRDCLDMWAVYLAGRPATAYAAPARADDLRGLPAAYVWAVQHDPLRDEAVEYATRLTRAGVPTELHVVPDACHGFEGLAPGSALAHRTVDRWLAAVAAGLGVELRHDDAEPL